MGCSSICGFTKSVTANNIDEAILKLYDTHEHIRQIYYWNGVEYVRYKNKNKENPESLPKVTILESRE
jgi:hypothetical protein